MPVPVPGEPVDTSFADPDRTPTAETGGAPTPRGSADRTDPFAEAEEEHQRSRRFSASLVDWISPAPMSLS